MWIVALALKRPYTFVVMALLIGILGLVTIQRMPTDIFPEIDIPVVSVIWSLNGLPPQEFERRVVTVCERAMTTTVNDIDHIESQTYNGVAVIKVFFHPGARIEAAVAQVTSINQTIVRILPPGMTPPAILRYSASSVPILQASVHSNQLSEQEIFDLGLNFIRTQLATIQGASCPLPYGGKSREIVVDLDPARLEAKGLAPLDVSNAVSAQNLVLPSGIAKIGDREYNIRLNGSPEVLDALNDLPIKKVNGAMVYVRDVAHVRDGFAPQTNIVRENGRRATLMTVLKSGGASTLDIVSRVKAILPKIMATMPPSLKLDLLFDQSIFVRNAINGVLTEGAIAACLTALMILLFLGSWRSTLIVAISIPLAVLTSIIVMSALGQTLNVMTLGGLALAVGILVDDATVEIENIHRNLGMGKPLRRAILDGAQQIAVPTFVSTLSICIVFTPVIFLSGAAKSLFTPLAMGVVFAMMASYLLSRTLIPTLVVYLLKSEVHLYAEEHAHDHVPGEAPGHDGHAEPGGNGAHAIAAHDGNGSNGNGARTHGEDRTRNAGPIWRVHHRFNAAFERMRDRYYSALEQALHRPGLVITAFLVFCGASMLLLPILGQDFFPQVDAGQLRLHVRAPAGTRLEQTEAVFQQVEDTIRQVIPRDQLKMILDNIGLPLSGINLAFSDSATVGSADGEILIQLDEHHAPTPEYVRKLRDVLRTKYPQETFFFQPADIVNQILNFGLPAPIDVQVVGRNQQATYPIALNLRRQIEKVPGAVDVHVHQIANVPELYVNVDRTRAEDLGLTEKDVASNLLVSLASSGQSSPNFWINPQNGVNYTIAVQTPQYWVNSVGALQSTPVSSNGTQTQLLSNLATLGRGSSMAIINHYNVQPTFDIYASTQGRDLGGVANDIDRILAKEQHHMPKGTSLVMRGQVESMRSSFLGLGMGLIFAVVLVYLLMVVNFQSWLDPFIILMALPGALAGIAWMLFLSQTTLSVPALMGAIMCVGVATANSILMITFANEQRVEGHDAISAALSAGYTRLRPVLMTAAAMIIGMLPMSLGLGEGGEQNAPLGRAVIGGLLFATFATLFFVPTVYSVMRKKQPEKVLSDEDLLVEVPAPATTVG